MFFSRQKLAERIREHEDSACKEVPIVAPVSDDMFVTRDGDYIRTFLFDGLPFESRSLAEVYAWRDQENFLIRQIASPHLSLVFHVDHYQSGEYPEGEFTDGFARELDIKYRESLARHRLFVNDLYVTLVYRPVADSVGRVFSRASKMDINGWEKLARDAQKELNSISRMFLSSMARYSPQVLGTYVYRGGVFSKALEFYHYLVNGYRQRIPFIRGNIQELLMTTRPIFGREVAELRGPGESVFIGALGIKEYTPQPEPGHFDELMSLPFPFVLTQTFQCVSKTEAKRRLNLQGIHLEQVQDDGVSEIAEIADRSEGGARDELARNIFSIGNYCLTFIVKAPSSEGVADCLTQAVTAFADAEFVVAREDLGLQPAFWSQLPGNSMYLVRPVAITSRNMACFASLHNHQRGKPNGNHWGSALMLLRTASNAPYYFNLHQEDVGHTAIFGPTGSGKTVLQGMIAAMLRKTEYGAKQIYFDYGRGAEIFLRALGGSYSMLKNAEPTGWNPFWLEATPENIDFVRKLIRSLGTMQDLGLSEEKELDVAVGRVFDLTLDKRRLSSLLMFINQNAPEGIARRIEKWIDPKQMGWLFNNPEDTLGFDGDVVGFDMTHFLDNADTRIPSMMYLFYRMKQIKGRVCVSIDEFWKALDSEYFIEEIKSWYNTDRKRDRFLIVSTQSIYQAAQSKIARAIIEQTGRGTQIFLPNAQADRRDYVEVFKLTEAEYQIVRVTPPHTRRFLVKQGSDSVIPELDLSELKDFLLFLSGTEKNVERLDKIRAEVGDDPHVWGPILLDNVRSITERRVF